MKSVVLIALCILLFSACRTLKSKKNERQDEQIRQEQIDQEQIKKERDRIINRKLFIPKDSLINK